MKPDFKTTDSLEFIKLANEAVDLSSRYNEIMARLEELVKSGDASRDHDLELVEEFSGRWCAPKRFKTKPDSSHFNIGDTYYWGGILRHEVEFNKQPLTVSLNGYPAVTFWEHRVMVDTGEQLGVGFQKLWEYGEPQLLPVSPGDAICIKLMRAQDGKS